MSISNCAVRRGIGLSGREEIAFMPIDEESESDSSDSKSELLCKSDPSDSESDSEEDESGEEEDDDDDDESSLSESSSSEWESESLSRVSNTPSPRFISMYCSASSSTFSISTLDGLSRMR